VIIADKQWISDDPCDKASKARTRLDPPLLVHLRTDAKDHFTGHKFKLQSLVDFGYW
jgi:hypothetical protein